MTQEWTKGVILKVELQGPMPLDRRTEAFEPLVLTEEWQPIPLHPPLTFRLVVAADSPDQP